MFCCFCSTGCVPLIGIYSIHFFIRPTYYTAAIIVDATKKTQAAEAPDRVLSSIGISPSVLVLLLFVISLDIAQNKTEEPAKSKRQEETWY